MKNRRSIRMKELPLSERPRERLVRYGPESLSDAELIAILLGSGCRGMSALDLARLIVTESGGLSSLLGKDISFFKKFRGINTRKGAALHAVIEIARRIQQPDAGLSPTIRGPEDVAALFIPRLKGIYQERFFVVLLNAANRLIKDVELTRGTLTSSPVHPRETFKMAIAESAASIIVVHNHPSGNPEPSEDDISVTRKLVDSGKVLDIPVHDHVIVAGSQFVSFAQRNLL